jgi:DNA repair exonuclease SbcCD ATPase subunit
MLKEIETTIEDLYNFYQLYPEYKGMIKVETRYGFYEVEECDITSYNSEIIEIVTENNKFLKCSPEHNLFIKNKNWVKLQDIKLTDKLLTKNGEENIKSIKKLNYKEDLFDLQVKKVHEFYANEIVSHNSAILDALSFCLFGQPYRKIKIKELLNRKNKKNLKVSCEFVVDGKDKYVLTRCMNPDTIEILKNDEELELLSSKKLNQDEIDKIIGINYQMFKQVISLAVNYNKPFLSLQLNEKREIIEKIFNIVVFGSMLKILKKKNVDIKTKSEVNDRSITLLEQHLRSLRKRVLELTEAQNNFQSNKDKDLKTNDDRIKNFLSEKISLEEELDLIISSIESNIFDENELKNLKILREEIIKKINENEFESKSSNEMIELLDKYKVCPWCKTDITPEHREKEIKRLSKEIKEKQKSVSELKQERKEVEKNISKYENLLKELNDSQFKKDSLQEKISMIDRELSASEERRNEIFNREIEFNLTSVNKEFDDKKEEYKSIWIETKNIKKNIKNNDIVQSILSESGIKAYFFKKLIPILNVKINEYVKLFELPVIIQFDEFMNEKITNVENLRNEISYYSYSEGEKKRIDMSILLSFISITKTISNWNCNLLIIDELLDSAIDENGLEKLVSSLKNMVYDTKDLCIYIISHRLQQEYSSQFKNCLVLQKNGNNFSEIAYNKEVSNG